MISRCIASGMSSSVSAVFQPGSWSARRRPCRPGPSRPASRTARSASPGSRSRGRWARRRRPSRRADRRRAPMAHQEPVVGRVDHRGGEEAVEDDLSDPLVVLVLVAASLRNLDEGEQLVGDGSRRASSAIGGKATSPPHDEMGRRAAGGRPRPVAFAACGGGGAEPGASDEATLMLDFQPNAVHSGHLRGGAGATTTRRARLTIREPSSATDAPSCSRPAGPSSRSSTSTTSASHANEDSTSSATAPIVSVRSPP